MVAMGQEIEGIQFTDDDFELFHQRLTVETDLLKHKIKHQQCSNKTAIAGVELEAWLIDKNYQAAPVNDLFLAEFNDPLASPELAKFNFELNTQPHTLNKDVFANLYSQLETSWDKAIHCAEKFDASPLLIGVLPTLKKSDLRLSNMSDLNRYRALNEQILFARGQAVHLDINGVDHLRFDQHNVMLESAATSLQLHTQVPTDTAHHYYNASIMSSAFVVALAANSPFLFGKHLWHESRIPLFEQSIETGGYDGAANGPVKRVSFGTDYAHESIFECFHENLAHFPVLLPTCYDTDAERFKHLRLHNGTVWRWNRPIVGFDDDGIPHVRIEHRTPAAGPTILDSVANAAFYYGLTQYLYEQLVAGKHFIPFSQAKDNFYRAARLGLDAHVTWLDGEHVCVHHLIQTQLIMYAKLGLQNLEVDNDDINKFIQVIENRVVNKQNGSAWQIKYMQQSANNYVDMTKKYFINQQQAIPVSEWT
jgi:gamma-glutamyl:cysteine ligase YbdK (ATP-grasp superfamily)